MSSHAKNIAAPKGTNRNPARSLRKLLSLAPLSAVLVEPKRKLTLGDERIACFSSHPAIRMAMEQNEEQLFVVEALTTRKQVNDCLSAIERASSPQWLDRWSLEGWRDTTPSNRMIMLATRRKGAAYPEGIVMAERTIEVVCGPDGAAYVCYELAPTFVIVSELASRHGLSASLATTLSILMAADLSAVAGSLDAAVPQCHLTSAVLYGALGGDALTLGGLYFLYDIFANLDFTVETLDFHLQHVVMGAAYWLVVDRTHYVPQPIRDTSSAEESPSSKHH